MVEFTKDDQRRLFSGWGTISVVDRQNDYIDVLKEFRDAGVMEKMMQRGAPVMDSHSNHQVGRIISYEYKIAPSGQPGLYLVAEIFKNYPSDDEFWEALKEGKYSGFSLGGKASDKTPVCNENGCHNNLTGIESWEWSAVSVPANQEALIDNVNKLAKSYYENPILKYIIYKAKAYVKKPSDAPLGIKVHTGSEGGYYYNTEDNYGKSSSHSKIRLKRPDDTPIGIKVREDEDGFYYNSDDIKKARVYIKTPSEAPQGSQVHVGPEGGKFYETEDLRGKQREKVEREQYIPKVDIKSVREVVGEQLYENDYNKEVLPLLETYGKIATGKASDDEVNEVAEVIKRRLPNVIAFYEGVVRTSSDFADARRKHQKIVDILLKLQNEFNNAKTSKDKVINIDNFMSVAHTGGDNVVRRLWNRPAYTGDVASKYLDYLRENIGKSIQKARVYIKTPSEAPQGSQVHVGPEGGKFYETEEIENRGKREQVERQQTKPQIKVKTLQEILGDEAYSRMDHWKSGRELKDLLNTYTKISTGTASDKEINRNFDLIKRNLHHIYQMYANEAGMEEYERGHIENNPYLQAHKIVADKIEKLENEFNQVKDRKDKIIAIDNFIDTAHTSGPDIIARIWNAKSFLYENNEDDGFPFVSHYIPKYMDYLRTNIGKSIQKAKVYIKTPSEAPQGVKVEEGKRGGHYYESKDSEQETSQPQEAVKRNISALNPMVYDNYDALLHFETGQEALLPYMCDPEKSYNKIEQDIGKSVILNEYKTEIPSGWENSMQVLHNPLVIEWKDWKQRLSQFYNNKTGKELRNSLIEDGYDSIVTIDGENVSEIVLLKPKIVSYEELKKTDHYDGTDGINDRFKFKDVIITVPINDLPTNVHLRILECSEAFKFSSLKTKPIIRFLGKSKHEIFKWKDREGILHESEYGGTAAYDDNQINIYDDFGVDDIVYHEVGHFVYKKMMSSVDVISDATIKGLIHVDKIEEYNKTIEILRNHNVSMNYETMYKILDDLEYARSLNILPDLFEAGLHYHDNAYACISGIRDRLKMGYIPELSPFEEQQWKRFKTSYKAELKSQAVRNEWLNIWQTEGYKDKEYANRNNNETFAEFYQTMHNILSTKNIQLKNDWITATALQHPLKTAFFKKHVIKKWVTNKKQGEK